MGGYGRVRSYVDRFRSHGTTPSIPTIPPNVGHPIAPHPNGKDSYRVRTAEIDRKPYIRTEIELNTWMGRQLCLFSDDLLMISVGSGRLACKIPASASASWIGFPLGMMVVTT